MTIEGVEGAIGAMWDVIREQHPEVPAVTVMVNRAGCARVGHLVPKEWRFLLGSERQLVVVGTDTLAAGADGVLVDLVHEGAHAVAAARSVRDTSRDGRYHNASFQAVAEELGLMVWHDGARGVSVAGVEPAARVAYEGALTELAAKIEATDMAGEPGKRSGARLVVAVCGCKPGRRIWAARSTLDGPGIACVKCGDVFTRP